MNTKLLNEKALSVIDQYIHFGIGQNVINIPYYNNKRIGLHGGLPVQVGKGSPKDIYDEIQNISILEKINVKNLDSVTLKKYLVDHNIGIDCFGLAYYILNAECIGRGKSTLDKYISFTDSGGIFGRIKAKMMPEKNISDSVLANDKNSKIVSLKEILPGDIITMIGEVNKNTRDPQRNHVLIIHQVEYQNFIPTTLHYTHAISWPTDGEYDHGVRQGTIEIIDAEKILIEQKWIEKEKINGENYTFMRAIKNTI